MTKLKDKNYDYLCRSHSARSERGEMYRISPSKLTKKELEDLYFSLLENNMELKKTVNAQKDRVRVLSTRVQRITSTQKSLQARENKDCCAATKALVNEQKDSINDLKKANAHLSDRIKVLNMKLCSAKQFLNRNPMTSATRCLRCSGTSTWIKNSASSTKPDCEHYKSVSCQNLGNTVGFNSVQTETMDGQPIEAGATQTDIEESGPSSDRGCKANKCKNTMNELNQKIAYLEMELANTHCEYSERIARLEREVNAVRADNARVRGERVASQQREQHGTKLALSAARRLRDTERLCAELESCLAIEKSKVAELEAQLKMSDVSARVKKAIDEQLAALNITAAVPSNQKSDVKDKQPPKPAPLVGMPLSIPLEKDNESLIPLTGEDNIKVLNDIDEKPELQRDNISTKSLQNLTKNAGNDVKSDDMVLVKSPDDNKKVNEESATDVIKLTEEGPVVSEQELKEEQLRKKMAELQEEVDALKRAAAEQHNEIVFSENQPTPPVVNDYKFNHDNVPDNLYINKVNSSDTVDNMERANTNYALGTPANSYHKPILMNDAHAVTDSVANKNYNHDKTSNLEERRVKSVVSIQEPENKVSKPGKYAQQSVSKEDSCRKTDVISQDFSLRDTNTEPRDLFANSTNRPPISLESPKKLSYDFTGRPSWFVKDSEDMRVLKTNRVDSGEKNTTEQVGESKNSNDPGDVDVKQNDVQDTSCPTCKHTQKNEVHFKHVICECEVPNTKAEAYSTTHKPANMLSSVVEKRDSTAQSDVLLKYEAKRDSTAQSEVFSKSGAKRDSIAQTDAASKSKKITMYSKPTISECVVPETDTKADFKSQRNPHSMPARDVSQTNYRIPSPEDSQYHTWTEKMSKFMEVTKDKTNDTNNTSNTVAEVQSTKMVRVQETVYSEPTICECGAPDREKQTDTQYSWKYKMTSFFSRTKDKKQHKTESEAQVDLFPTHDTKTDSQAQTNAASKTASKRQTGNENLLQTEDDIRMKPLLEAKSRKNEYDPPAIVEVPSSIKRRLSNGSDGVTYTVKAPEPPSNMPQIGTYTIIHQNRDRLSDPRVSSTEVVESRPVSPDTDREISRMTDLPSEKDATTTPGPRSLSPGEELVDKATTTNTDTSTSPYHEPLSEGEVPIAVKPLKVEAQRKSQVQQMESALADVTESLARTRYLMRNSRQALPQTQPPVPDSEGLVELRPTPAKPSIGVEASKCTFTLQIGSIVLSDEALIYTTDKRLMVTWQFYTQNVTMTRVRSGRVLLFDFSTEYEVKISDEFLDYMSNNSLPIKICEVNTDEDEAVATCSLPLREFLTRVNERVGLSVPLLRGSGSICSMSAELGVVDVSCMLRCEQAALHKALNSRQSSGSVDQRLTTAAPASAAGALEEPKTADKDNQTNTEAVKLRNQSDNTELRRTSDSATQNQITRDVKDNYVQVNPVLVPSVYYPERLRAPSQTIDSPPKCKISDDITTPESSKIYINEVPTKIRTEKDMKDALGRASHETDSFLSNFGPNDDCTSIAHSLSNWRNGKFHRNKSFRPDFQQKLSRSIERRASDDTLALSDKSNRSKKFVTIDTQKINPGIEFPQKHASGPTDELTRQKIDVTVLWLALNEGSTVMADPKVQRLYIAYTFLGRAGADLETPISIPKPKSYGDKCYFNFTKTFYLSESDLVLLGHMAKCRSAERGRAVGDCVVFSVVSEPAPAPAHEPGACEDQGYAYLYLGDLLSYGTDSTSYTEVLPVRSKTGEDVCGVLAVRIDGLDVIRRCLFMAKSTSF